ncbi:MAG: TPM domain-containing protein [Candidatus Niyogibacteria bacterium]|nr:TPM domain-containing protein [Candidatus Niyogibacteria bacterium]
MKKFIAAILLIGSAALCGAAFAYTSPGKPIGRVNDFAGALTVEQVRALENELAAFARDKGHEIAVVTVPTIGDETIENYANQLFREWGVGNKDLNNGVLFLVAINDRQMRIEVGYGLEGALTDVESKHILDDVAAPYFKSGNYTEGILNGTRGIEQAIEEEVLPENSVQNNNVVHLGDNGWQSLIFIFWVMAVFLGATRSWWLGGILGAVFGIIAWAAFAFSWYFVPLGVVVGLIFDFIVSVLGIGRHGGFWGGFGGGGGGLGGFGGFGGGSSGGGGSSSRW